MSGPISSERKVFRGRLARRQFWAEVFGWIVGIGLVVEYWKEIADCIIKKHWPATEVIGGILVTAGVFGEVFFSRLAGITTDRLQELADSDVEKANKSATEAIERAEKESSARLAIVKQLQWRSFSAKQMDDFVAAIKGKIPPLAVFTLTTDDEAANFGFVVRQAFEKAEVVIQWYPLEKFPSSHFSGDRHLVLYDVQMSDASTILMEAFGAVGYAIHFFPSKVLTEQIPIPALLIGKRQTPFVPFPEYMFPELPAPKMPWE